MKRITTYTDESGIATKKKFIVVTVIVDNTQREVFEAVLNEIEKISGKNRKWADVGVMIRTRYAKLLLKKNIFSLSTVYFSIFNNKSDYVTLVSSQVAKSILTFAGKEEYNSTIFLDKVNNRVTEGIQREIKRYKIRHKKIRSLDDTNNVGLQFADAMCGLIRDITNKDIDESYRGIYKKLQQI